MFLVLNFLMLAFYDFDFIASGECAPPSLSVVRVLPLGVLCGSYCLLCLNGTAVAIINKQIASLSVRSMCNFRILCVVFLKPVALLVIVIV